MNRHSSASWATGHRQFLLEQARTDKVLFRRQALEKTGGFRFWDQLPPEHCGEDVVAQWRVMECFGGAGILPTGAMHLESPTTVTDRRVEAFDLVLPDSRQEHDLPLIKERN